MVGIGKIKTSKIKEREFWYAFGRAFTHWKHVEREMLFTFQYIVAGKQNITVNAVWDTIINFRMKVDMIDNTIKKSLVPSEHRTQWFAIKKEILSCAQLRNRLAHEEVIYTLTGNQTPSRMPVLTGPDPRHGTNSDEIIIWGTRFVTLASSIFDFNVDLWKSGSMHEKKEINTISPYRRYLPELFD